MNKTFSSAAAAWLLAYSAVCYANTTLAQDVMAFDWISLGLAGAAGLLGGIGRTMVTMMSFKALVGDLKFVLAKDMLVAVVGGVFALICVEAWNSAADAMKQIDLVSLPQITRGWRIWILVVAGASRGRWLGVVDKFVTDAIDNARAKVRNGAPADPAVSDVVPLNESKP
ncbi:hypothetical protein [Variovorax paradoxus]|uniref:Uncharacterized protein n=1 Tax=Variovorax paradoxus TaxID=34073 RepID=A0A679JI86_VARPD|nr:hypothetical protein VVAX_03522 [Variovorax paradoxus]